MTFRCLRTRFVTFPFAGLVMGAMCSQIASAQLNEVVAQVKAGPNEVLDGFHLIGTSGYAGQRINTSNYVYYGLDFAHVDGIGNSANTLSLVSGVFGGWVRGSFDESFGLQVNGGVDKILTSAPSVPNVKPDPHLHPAGFRDALWLGDTKGFTKGDTYVSSTGNPTGLWTWRSFSRIGTLPSGVRYFLGGLAAGPNAVPGIPEGPAELEGVFVGDPPIAILLGGTSLPNLPAPLRAIGAISPSFAISSSGAHCVAQVRLNNVAKQQVIVVNAAGHLQGGALVTPGANALFVGHKPDEKWAQFRSLGVANDGRVMIAATTTTEILGEPSSDDVLVFDGQLVARTGQTYATEPLKSIASARCNGDGDLFHVWITETGKWALFINDRRIVGWGDSIEFSAALGQPPPVNDTSLLNPLNLGRLECSERDSAGFVKAMFSARVLRVLTLIDEDYLIRASSAASTCVADMDQNGTLDIDDFIYFQTLFAMQDPQADVDENGTFDIDDYVYYQTLFAIGC